MATQTIATGLELYMDLVQQFPLRPIRSDKDLGQAIQVIDALLDKEDLEDAEQDYLDVLSDLVERYETEKHPMRPVPDAALLRHLIEAKGVAQVEVAEAVGIANSTLSEVLMGKRKLTRGHIARLAPYFGVQPSAFAFE